MTEKQLEQGNKLKKEIDNLDAFIGKVATAKLKISDGNWSLNVPDEFHEEYINQMALYQKDYLEKLSEKKYQLTIQFKEL